MAEILIFSLALFAFFFNFGNFFLEVTLLVTQLFNFFIGAGNNSFFSFQLFDQSFMIFLSLMQNIFKFAVGGLKLPGFLLKLLEGGQRLIKKFVESFTLVFALGSLFLELFKLNREKSTVMERDLFYST